MKTRSNEANGLRALIDELFARVSKAIAGGGSELAHGFGDNGTTTPINISPTGTIVASVTVTPRTTGKFRMQGDAVLIASSAPTGGFLGVGHGAGAIGAGQVPDYRIEGATTMAANDVGVTVAINVEHPTTFPVGVPVQLNLIAIGGAGGGVTVTGDTSAQLVVQELSN